MFQASFHSMVTLRMFYYAPPDTGVSDLQLVAVERLPSIEGEMEIWMDGTFLRGWFFCPGFAGTAPFTRGILGGLCGNGWKDNYSAGKKSFRLILGGRICYNELRI